MGKYVFGVDVGGTTVKIGLFNTDGNVLEKWEIPTRTEEKGAYVLPDISEAIQKKIDEKNLDRAEIMGIGIGVPGPVDSASVCHGAVNLGWEDVNIAKELYELTGLSAVAGNDANVAALGEMWKGGGQGYSSLVAVTLGTGVGGGIIVEGKLLAGYSGSGGEIGHMHVMDEEPEACGCGNFGCLEQYSSATGVVTLAKRALKDNTLPTVLKAEDLSAKAVFDAAKEGDELALKVVKEFGEVLGKGLAIIACIINPEVFVIGGGVSKAGPMLFDYIRPSFEKYVFPGSLGTKFTLATLGNDAGIFGAAKLILDQAEESHYRQ